MMRFSACMFVKGLEVNSASGCTIFLSTYHHTVAPFSRDIGGDRGYDSKANIHFKTGFDLILEVKGDFIRAVVSHRLSIWINHKVHGGPSHLGKWLVWAYIECARLVVVEQDILEIKSVIICGFGR